MAIDLRPDEGLAPDQAAPKAAACARRADVGLRPDQFPEVMVTALRREDLALWAAKCDIKVIGAPD